MLLDLDMPESGFQALLELIPDRKRPAIAVVVLTHLISPVVGELAKKNGARDCLVKQHTSPEELETVIQQAMSSIKAARNH